MKIIPLRITDQESSTDTVRHYAKVI